MATRIYTGIKDKARWIYRLYVGVSNKARRVKKAYISVNGIARLCFDAIVKVKYKTSLTASFTEKEVFLGDAYGNFPITAKTDRHDFWFFPDDTSSSDSSIKYVNNPWQSYYDLNWNKTNGPTKNFIAEEYGYHYDNIGKAAGFPLCSLNTQTKCMKNEDHTLQHVGVQKIKATFVGASGLDSIFTGNSYADVYSSNGNVIVRYDAGIGPLGAGFTALGFPDTIIKSGTLNLYSGSRITVHARHSDGWNNVGSNGSACAIYLDGVKKKGRGEWTYVLPNNIKAVKVTIDIDNHYDGGQSWVVRITTTPI